MSAQRNFISGQKLREMLAGKKSVFMFALGRKRVEANQGFIDEAGMTHDETALRQPIQKLSHQGAEIGLSGKIISAGESGIEGDAGGRGAGAKLSAQEVEKQRLRRAKPLGQGLMASALADPGVG